MNKAVYAFICWLSVWKNAPVNENADKLQTYASYEGDVLNEKQTCDSSAWKIPGLHMQSQLFMANANFGEIKKKLTINVKYIIFVPLFLVQTIF